MTNPKCMHCSQELRGPFASQSADLQAQLEAAQAEAAKAVAARVYYDRKFSKGIFLISNEYVELIKHLRLAEAVVEAARAHLLGRGVITLRDALEAYDRNREKESADDAR